MKIGWVYHPQLLRHETGKSHVERPERLLAIVEAVGQAGLWRHLEPLHFAPATAEQLSLVHAPAYIDVVRLLCEEGFTFIGDAATCICSSSYEVAALAAGGVLAACDAVAAGLVTRVFCAVRPPGHHAEMDQAGGFCLFNHVALAAEHLIRDHGWQRVAIVDIDAHHGNGTQHIFEQRRDVFYISLHERPESLPYPGTGSDTEEGSGAGLGYTLNIPLDRGCSGSEYCDRIRQLVVPALDSFQPELVLLSAGFDALMWDTTSHLALEPASYATATALLVAAARRHAGGRLISVLEGGYDLGQMPAAVVAHLRPCWPSREATHFAQ